jgi:hypothetical protein
MIRFGVKGHDRVLSKFFHQKREEFSGEAKILVILKIHGDSGEGDG